MQIKTPLTGARICIRDYQKTDLAFVTGMWFDAENGRFMSDPPAEGVDAVYQKALDEMEDSALGFYFVIELRATGERIGTCCAFPQDEEGTFDETHRCYDIGYCIRKTHWRQGYGTEAVRLLMDWAAARGAREMTAEAAKENTASCKMLEKLGFFVLREGSFRKYHTETVFPSRVYAKMLDGEERESTKKERAAQEKHAEKAE